MVGTAIIAIEYDENTRELLRNVQRADALSGARGNSNLQASVAKGFEAAGEALFPAREIRQGEAEVIPAVGGAAVTDQASGGFTVA
mgnify:CR=1 FL=1